MTNKYDVFALGNALVDLEYQISDDFLSQNGLTKGHMQLAEQTEQKALLNKLPEMTKKASGGSAANTIACLAHMDNRTYLCCRVSEDEFGQFYAHDLKEAGIISNVQSERHGGTTGSCVIMLTDDAERTMQTFLGESALLEADNIDEEALKQSTYLYIEGYLVTADGSFDAIMKAKQIAKENGILQALSLSDPGIVEFFKDRMNQLIGEGVDLLFCNEEEALTIADTDSLDAAADYLKQYAKQFVITLGSKGVYLYDGEQSTTISAQPVKAIDTNGAGDNFAGGFLHALIQGKSFVEAGEFACKVAAKLICEYGPRLEQTSYKALASEL